MKKKTKKTAKKKASAKKKCGCAVKKTAKKKRPAAKSAKPKQALLEEIGKITHYFPRVKAGVIMLKKPLAVGEEIYIKGHTTDFKQKISSMQINRLPVQKAKAKDEIGILVKKRVRAGDKVYRV